MIDRTEASFDAVRTGGRIEYTHAESGGVIRFDRIDPQRNQVYAYVEVFDPTSGADPVAYGSVNLTSPGSRQGLIAKVPESTVPWSRLLHTAAYQVIQNQFEGAPSVKLADIDTSDTTGWLIEPLVEGSGATILAAAGASAKSYICLAAAVSVASGEPIIGDLVPVTTGPVLYLDWEADDKTHAHRLRLICAGAGIGTDIPVHYRRESQPLARTISQVTQICDELGVVLLVVDSVMLARSGDAFGPQDTAALFAAIREIGRPALLADHKSREALSKGKAGAYGSIVGENSARRVWEITGAVNDPGRKTVRLENTKANNADRNDPIAVALTWTEAPRPAVTIELTDSPSGLSFTVERSGAHWQAIQSVLEESDPLTIAGLQERLRHSGIDVKDGTIRRTLSRYPDRFTNVGTPTRGLWTTASHNPELFADNTPDHVEPPNDLTAEQLGQPDVEYVY